jgi:hypothetical protein
MGIISRIFRFKPERPFVEFPDGRLRSSAEAVLTGITIYRKQGGGRPAFISWQGQGSRPDSYHIIDAHLDGDYLGFGEVEIDLGKICTQEGLSYAALRGRTPVELNISSLSDTQVADFLRTVFTRHLGVRPFSDTGEYCIGFEYERRANDVDIASGRSAGAEVEVVGRVCIPRKMRFPVFVAPGAGRRPDAERPSTGDTCHSLYA